MRDSARRTGAESDPHTNWMTCVVDRREHAVTDENFGGLRLGLGYYTAVCGHVTFPQALAAPHGPRCAECIGDLAASRAEKVHRRLRMLPVAGIELGRRLWERRFSRAAVA